MDRLYSNHPLGQWCIDGTRVGLLLTLIVAVGLVGAMLWIGVSQVWRVGLWVITGQLGVVILSTILLTIFSGLIAVPVGVGTAIFLVEYRRPQWLVRLTRLVVYNLSGTPSIIFGLFGALLFVDTVGTWLDGVFFPQQPLPVFGVGSFLWAVVTVAIMDLPIIILATEEGLSLISDDIRAASYALGATRLKTLLEVVLPQIYPAILSGFIRAAARSFSVVVPFMMLGLLYTIPNLPINTTFPFVEWTQPVSHITLYILEQSFVEPIQNPDGTAPRALFAAAILLIFVLGLSLTAIWMRHRIRKRFLEVPMLEFPDDATRNEL